MKILVIAAHPDDEILGCGGTILRHTKNGDEVYVCILTDGAITRYKRDMIKTLKKNARDANKILGVSQIIFNDLPNQMLDTLPLSKIIYTIENVIKEVKPNIIYTHDKGDLNRDHVIVYEATLVATRPLPGKKIEQLLTYFVSSSSEYSDVDEKSIFIPNTFIDITKEMDAKIKAFSCYDTEIRPYPHPRSVEAIRIYAQRWGLQVGLEYAEAFRIIRQINSK